MEKLTMMQKVAYGALGGLSLSLLVLIKGGFLLDRIGMDFQVGYMVCFSYVLLGMIVAAVFAENSLSREKNRRSSFVSGFLAPSILIAFLNTGSMQGMEIEIPDWSSVPVGEIVGGMPDGIGPGGSIKEHSGDWDYGWLDLFVSDAYANTVSSDDIEKLTPEHVNPGFVKSVASTYQGTKSKYPYMLVVAKADKKQQALNIANLLNNYISTKGIALSSAKVYLVKNAYVVTIDGILSSEDAEFYSKMAKEVAYDMRKSPSGIKADQQVMKMLYGAQAVQGRKLFISIKGK